MSPKTDLYGLLCHFGCFHHPQVDTYLWVMQKKTLESKCSEVPMEAFSMVCVPISTMWSCFFLPSRVGPYSLMAAGS